MCSEDRSLYVGVNLHDCLWPHMRKCKGTFLMHWVPIGPGRLSPKAPLVCVTTQIHRIEKSRRLRSMEGYAGLLMPRTNGTTKTLTYRALEQGRCQGQAAVQMRGWICAVGPHFNIPAESSRIYMAHTICAPTHSGRPVVSFTTGILT